MYKLASLILLTCLTRLAMGQVYEIPLTANYELLSLSNFSRNDATDQIRIFVPVNKSVSFCPEADLFPDSSSTVAFATCMPLNYGTVTIEDSCITYQNSGGVGQDIICMEICDSNKVCKAYEIIIITREILLPPFIEDFSYDGPAPDPTLWLDQQVYVNNTLAQDPISIGVATFDGIDQNGTPYAGGPGYSDFLTSTFIDLSRFDDVYFSFFAQQKGYGIKPRLQDSLMVDFKNESGNWVRVLQLEGLPNSYATKDPAPPFSFHEIPVKSEFRHEGFQFRFRNKSKNLGLQEFWHVDYIRVGNRDNTNRVFRDIAFTQLPTPVIAPYSHMPATHFNRERVRSSIESRLYNFNSGNQQIDNPTFTLSLDNVPLFSRTFIEPVSMWNLPPERTFFDFPVDQMGSDNYRAMQDAVENNLVENETVSLTSRLSFDLSSEILTGSRNNEVRGTTEFSNYFAYDDGTAESAVVEQGEIGSTQLALQFEATIDDSLKGIQFLFPHIEGGEGVVRFNMYVWLDTLDDEPEFSQDFITPVYADQFFDTLQGYATYDLRDAETDEKIAFAIPRGPFYIGFAQINTGSNIKLPLGYDLNMTGGHPYFFFNNGNGWASAGANIREGSLMIRPIVGKGEVISTPVIDVIPNLINIYPNPAYDRINFDYQFAQASKWRIKLIHYLGMEILSSPLRKDIDISHLPPGPYVLHLYDPNDKLSQSTKIQIIR